MSMKKVKIKKRYISADVLPQIGVTTRREGGRKYIPDRNWDLELVLEELLLCKNVWQF
jgi:hypothetical protein